MGSWAVTRLVDGDFDLGTVLPTLVEVATTVGKDASVIAVDIPLSYVSPGTKGYQKRIFELFQLGAP